MDYIPCRSQADKVQAAISKASALSFTGKSRTRQEFRGDCDVNAVVRRYSAGDIPLKSVQYGSQDFDLDPTAAHQMLHDVGEVYKRLPVKLRDRYPSMLDLARAIQTGQVKVSDKSKGELTEQYNKARKAEVDAAVAAAVAAKPAKDS